jgi:ABC-type glutathione transport system ATPase component
MASTADSSPVIVARNLRKRFLRKNKETVEALDDVSFSVARGGLAALVGPDGAARRP